MFTTYCVCNNNILLLIPTQQQQHKVYSIAHTFRLSILANLLEDSLQKLSYKWISTVTITAVYHTLYHANKLQASTITIISTIASYPLSIQTKWHLWHSISVSNNSVSTLIIVDCFVQSHRQLDFGLLLGPLKPLPTFSMLALLYPALGPPSVATQLACLEGKLVCPSWA